MKQSPRRGTWGVRLLIRSLTVVLAILFFWLLGFVVEDIEAIKGPDFAEIERHHVDASLVVDKRQIERQIGDLERVIENTREQQRLVGESSQNLQRTINQMLDLQRLSIQKAIALSETERNTLTTSLKQFQDSQKTYQELNQKIADLTSQKFKLRDKSTQLDERLAAQRKPAEREYERRQESHRLRLASYQLAILVPLLLVVAYPLIRKRHSIYYPLLVAVGGATLLKVAIVVHEYFPSRYFKYILISTLLAIVALALVRLIRTRAFPKVECLKKQYREGYERFLCPVCEYPIRTGPRRFLYWTRRTVHKVLPQGDASSEMPYVCPCCGEELFETCPACQKVRHSLLDHCEHCGAKQDRLEERVEL
ncbi:MAG: hypothetical protein ABFC63_09175 [Thermoguttaceae bacterium]